VRVLIVPDKFKGTLTADRVANAIAAGWKKVRPKDRLELLPMSDGGDGFGPVIGGLLNARLRTVATLDAAQRPCRARWWWAEARRIAILETAQSNGLALLPKGRFHPFDLDTTGVAKLIQSALKAGATTCLLGVGGSATNDGGFGMARALGWKFKDRDGLDLERWTDLDRLVDLHPPEAGLPKCRFLVATDVSNPLLGKTGASRIYGPQKGLKPSDMETAERHLGQLARVVRKSIGFDDRLPGCGAAGGLGYGLQAFLGARRELGFDVFARLSRLEKAITRADLVVTGEGAVDESSLMGKGVGQLLELCGGLGRPVVILGGRVELGRNRPRALLAAKGLVDIADTETALRQPARLLACLAGGVAAELP
jgi:glycerate kinase